MSERVTISLERYERYREIEEELKDVNKTNSLISTVLKTLIELNFTYENTSEVLPKLKDLLNRANIGVTFDSDELGTKVHLGNKDYVLEMVGDSLFKREKDGSF